MTQNDERISMMGVGDDLILITASNQRNVYRINTKNHQHSNPVIAVAVDRQDQISKELLDKIYYVNIWTRCNDEVTFIAMAI